MTSCLFSQMTSMRICHCYQPFIVQSLQELINSVCKQERRQLHDILNIMTGSVSKAK